MVRFNPEPSKHRHEQIRQWIVPFPIKRQMLAMAETPAGKEGRKIGGHVGVGIPQIRSVENHGSIQERFTVLTDVTKSGEELSQELHMPLINGFELRQLCFRSTLVRAVRVTVGNFHAFNIVGFLRMDADSKRILE